MKGRNVEAIMRKVHKQGQTRAKDLSLDLHEGRESPYHR